MRRLAIVLSICVLDACATPAALRGAGDTANLQRCLDDEDPCASGGTGSATALAYGVGAAALGLGVGALIYRIARTGPSVDLRATASAAGR